MNAFRSTDCHEPKPSVLLSNLCAAFEYPPHKKIARDYDNDVITVIKSLGFANEIVIVKFCFYSWVVVVQQACVKREIFVRILLHGCFNA